MDTQAIRAQNRFMGFPCDEVLRNHSKGLYGRFYTLWADFCL